MRLRVRGGGRVAQVSVAEGRIMSNDTTGIATMTL
jgi:hypothetical protein